MERRPLRKAAATSATPNRSCSWPHGPFARAPAEDAYALSDAIREAKEKIRECTTCHNITDTNPCLYCIGPTRNHKTICVVEEAHNIMAIEKTRMYSGMYHV